jgi:hypothetical protein
MSKMQASNGGVTVLLGVGFLVLLVGYFMATEYARLATVLLVARFDIGTPVSNADLMKALVIEGGGIMAIGQGAILFIVGLFLLARNGVAQRVTVKSMGS